MLHQPLTTVLAAASVTGSHPGPGFYAEWVLIVGAVVGAPVYFVRRARGRRRRR
ncbi:hypothetical protein [Catenulispora subtropica]|uniref:Uncharacterized protein n=1 Tax=Catenulispora subtropica TaxID=450798 RepID=A0ABN2RAK6_9ACTN